MSKKKIIIGSSFTSFTCSAEGLAFISAHETATGSTMGATQKDAICGFIDRLKGNGTTNGSDIWAKMVAKGSILHPFTPTDDSTASAAAFGVDLISAATVGTFNNFVSGDFNPSGLTGGSTKYFDLGVNPNVWSQNSIGMYFYIQTSDFLNKLPIGSNDGTGGRNHYLQIDGSIPRFRARINNNVAFISAFDTVGSAVGLFGAQRPNSTTIDNVYNGVVTSSTTANSTTPPPENIYTMARNNNGSPANNFAGVCSGHAVNMPEMTADELADFYEAFSWYQSNVITGGR